MPSRGRCGIGKAPNTRYREGQAMIRYAAQSSLAILREHDRHISGDELA